MYRFVAAATLLILLGYGAVKAVPLIRGPVIELSSPTPYQAGQDGRIEVSGRAVHTSSLLLNGAPFLIDEQGRFATSLLLPRGGAILTLTATDRFGRTVTERRTVFVP